MPRSASSMTATRGPQPTSLLANDRVIPQRSSSVCPAVGHWESGRRGASGLRQLGVPAELVAAVGASGRFYVGVHDLALLLHPQGSLAAEGHRAARSRGRPAARAARYWIIPSLRLEGGAGGLEILRADAARALHDGFDARLAR